MKKITRSLRTCAFCHGVRYVSHPLAVSSRGLFQNERKLKMNALTIIGCAIGVIACLVALMVLFIVKRPREYVGDGKFE